MSLLFAIVSNILNDSVPCFFTGKHVQIFGVPFFLHRVPGYFQLPLHSVAGRHCFAHTKLNVQYWFRLFITNSTNSNISDINIRTRFTFHRRKNPEPRKIKKLNQAVQNRPDFTPSSSSLYGAHSAVSQTDSVSQNGDSPYKRQKTAKLPFSTKKWPAWQPRAVRSLGKNVEDIQTYKLRI